MYNFASAIFPQNLSLYSWKVITYLWFKVLSVASYYLFSIFLAIVGYHFEKQYVFCGDPQIDLFFDFFIRAEMLMIQAVCYRSKQMVIGRSNVWRVRWVG